MHRQIASYQDRFPSNVSRDLCERNEKYVNSDLGDLQNAVLVNSWMESTKSSGVQLSRASTHMDKRKDKGTNPTMRHYPRPRQAKSLKLPKQNASSEDNCSGLMKLLSVHRVGHAHTMKRNRSYDSQDTSNDGATTEGHPMPRQTVHKTKQSRIIMKKERPDGYGEKNVREQIIPHSSKKSETGKCSSYLPQKKGVNPELAVANADKQHLGSCLLQFHLTPPSGATSGGHGLGQKKPPKAFKSNSAHPHADRREMMANPFPELTIVHSSLVDTSGLPWKEEAKALIVQLLKSKGK